MLKECHHVAIIVSDYEKSREFYVNQLGLTVVRENYRPDRGDWKLDLRLGDMELEIFSAPKAPLRVTNPEARGLRHLCFRVENIGEAVDWLKAMGIETEPVRLDPYSNKKFTFFRDPDDLPLELHE